MCFNQVFNLLIRMANVHWQTGIRSVGSLHADKLGLHIGSLELRLSSLLLNIEKTVSAQYLETAMIYDNDTYYFSSLNGDEVWDRICGHWCHGQGHCLRKVIWQWHLVVCMQIVCIWVTRFKVEVIITRYIKIGFRSITWVMSDWYQWNLVC